MEIDPLILELARDDESSTGALVEKAARALVAFSGGQLADDREQFLDALVGVGRKLVEVRPALAPLFHLVTELYARAGEPADLVMVRRAVRTAAVEFTQSLAARNVKIADQAAGLLDGAGRVLTLGHSEVVEQALDASIAAGALAGVVIGEGRPGYDGRRMAARLAEAGAVGVKIVTDRALVRCLGEVDVVFLAARSIRADGVVARVGATGLAAAAKAAGKPAYALGGVMRLLPADAPLPDPCRVGDPASVWDAPPEGVTVENHRVEILPLKILKGVVMENGSIAPYEIEQRTRAMPVPPWL